MNDEGRIIPVEIDGRRYPIRSSLDPEYVVRLAAYVEDRIRLATAQTPDADAMRVAVLAALNIADELFRARESLESQGGEVAASAGELEQMLDRILMAS
jgi:cell division protein ZapA